MNNTELADVALRQKLLGSEIERLKSERELLSASIVKELGRRKRASVEVGSVTITLSSRRTGYSVADLKKRIDAAVFKRVTKLEVDGEAIKAEIKAGTISAKDAAAVEIRSRSFPVITQAA